MKSRKYMLNVLWNSVDEHRSQYTWRDGSRSYFFKGLKLEKLGKDVELYTISSTLYKIVPTYSVWYAYENGMEQLSNSMKLSIYTDRVNSEKYAMNEKSYEGYRKKIDALLELGVLDLNQIKEKYEELQTVES